MTSINDIVSVSTVIQDASVSRPSFGSIGFIMKHPLGPARRIYPTNPDGLAAMVSDGLTTGHPAYLKLQAINSQEVKPPQIKLYNRTTGITQTVTLTVTDVRAGFLYQWEVQLPSGTKTAQSYSVPTSGSPTLTTIATAIAALITALVGVQATASVAVITVTPDTVGDLFMINTFGPEFTFKDNSADAGIATELAAAQTLDRDFYAVVTDDASEAGCNAVAAWAQANKKIYEAPSADGDILTGSTTDLASDFKLAGYTRCGVMFSRSQSSCMAAALIGRQLSFDPGKSSWNNRPLVGVADNLTATEQANAVGKRCNMFVAVSGINVSFNVTTANGRLFETTRDVDWFESEIAAAEFEALVRNEIVPYDIVGKGIVKGAFMSVAATAETNGVFIPGSTKFTAPADGADASADVAIQRLKHGWTAKKRVPVRTIDIAGVVTL
jgi:hypothetical protein